MLLFSESTLFRFTPQDEGSGSSVVIVTGLLLCPVEASTIGLTLKVHIPAGS